jgi:hypothetical protein
MALPATHIRFAAAIAERMVVSDMGAYLSGTLYPDSRWVTGIDRQVTHGRQCLDPGFSSDDFTTGWHVHCLCDRIQGDIHTGLLDDLSKMSPDARWIRMAAAKIVQDMNDAAREDLDARLSLVTHSRTPNGESSEAVAAYFGAVRRAYRRSENLDWSDYARLWTDVGLDRQRISRIEHQVQRLLADEILVPRLHGAFERMVAWWDNRFSVRPDRKERLNHGSRPYCSADQRQSQRLTPDDGRLR